ncbi:MAG: DUF4364 family protein [Lachnospiraceae bacterium]|nr:DUF4364 family protein [Lachnospiraceae bacterium]
MEPLTLYKLMMLYLLRAVKYPLTRSQLSDFMLGREYCSYFTFQQALQELLDAHLMREESIRNYVRYILTREGEDTLEFFGGDLPEGVRNDMNAFLDENMIKLREQVGTMAGFQENSLGEYTVTLEIREGKEALMKINLSVPSEEQAQILCDNWKGSDQVIYEYVMKELLRG